MKKPLTEEQRKALLSLYVKSGMLRVISDLAHNLCAPLWWNEPDQVGPGHGRMAGTVCLVNTGSAILGITADHVHTWITERLDSGAVQWCQLGGHTFDPRNHIVDRDPVLDLATYRLSEIQISATGRHLHSPRSWPPPRLAANDICVTGGYPWELSFTQPAPDGPAYSQAPTHRNVSFVHFFSRLTDSAADMDHILIGEKTSIPWHGKGLPPDTNLGGMSGGPTFRFSESPGELSTLTLCSITSKHSFEVIHARPLTLVHEDGTIVRAGETS